MNKGSTDIVKNPAGVITFPLQSERLYLKVLQVDLSLQFLEASLMCIDNSFSVYLIFENHDYQCENISDIKRNILLIALLVK